MTRSLHAGALLLVGLVGAGCENNPTYVDQDTLGCDRVRGYSIGLPVGESLSTGDCRLSDGSAVDYYRVRISGGRTVWAVMTSSTIDPYVVILGRDGRLVAEETRGGAGLSEVVAYLPSGTYYIAATSYYDREYGPYRLTSGYD